MFSSKLPNSSVTSAFRSNFTKHFPYPAIIFVLLASVDKRLANASKAPSKLFSIYNFSASLIYLLISSCFPPPDATITFLIKSFTSFSGIAPENPSIGCPS